MCCRYYIAEDDREGELADIIAGLQRYEGKQVRLSGEIFPTDRVPVIANDRRLKPRPFAMEWGYRLSGGKLLINARSETAGQRELFRDGMKQRRCLIPFSWYFEWETRGKEKRRYAIRPGGMNTCRMAGIYRLEQGRPVFTVLTREPADSIAFIHDRMPVILPEEAGKDWLNPRFTAEDVLCAAMLNVKGEATREEKNDVPDPLQLCFL